MDGGTARQDAASSGGPGDAGDAGNEAAGPELVREPVSIALGRGHTCVVVRDVLGGVEQTTKSFCWGAAAEGQLGGDGAPFVSPNLPANVELRTVVSHASSDTTCAIADDLSIYCWGKNDRSQCGVDPSPTAPPAALGIAGLTLKSDVLAVGGASGCLSRMTSIGLSLACWGRNESCELGTGAAPCTPESDPTPGVGALHESLTDASSIGLGNAHGCVIGPSTSPIVSCWGANDKGQSGAGAAVVSPPEQVMSGGNALEALAVAGGDTFSCALTANKRVLCWGDNTLGAISDGAKVAGALPAEAFPNVDVAAIAAGAGVLCAIDGAGNVRCRGAGDKGQLGRGGVVTDGSAGAVAELANVVAIAVGGAHACAIVAPPSGPRSVRCWGDNALGQVDPTRADKLPVLAPTTVPIPLQ